MTVFDTIRVLVFDTARVAVADTVVVGGSLEKDVSDWLVPLFVALVTVVGSMLVGVYIAKMTARHTVEEGREEAKRRMKKLTDSLEANIGPYPNQVLFKNGGNETILNAIGYIEIKIERPDQVILKNELDPSKFQQAYIDEIKALGKPASNDDDKDQYSIKMPLCWSMGEYVGGDVGIKNPGVTNIRPCETRGLSVFDIEPISTKGKTSSSSFNAIQIPSEFGYSTILKNPKIRSGVFLKFPEEGQSYEASILLFSDNTTSKKWEIRLKRQNESEMSLEIVNSSAADC